MHEAVFSCLVSQGKEQYSVFLSFRATSDKLLAQLVFDELNHRWESADTFIINDYGHSSFLILCVCSITQHGNRVTVHWDPLRMIRGEEHFNQNVVSGLLSSLCIVPILSYGAIAPLAAVPKDRWAEKSLDLQHLEGTEDDRDDALLKVWSSQIRTHILFLIVNLK